MFGETKKVLLICSKFNKQHNKMKIKNLKIGQILKDGYNECEVFMIHKDKFEVEYISGACFTYNQNDLDNNVLTSYIG